MRTLALTCLGIIFSAPLLADELPDPDDPQAKADAPAEEETATAPVLKIESPLVVGEHYTLDMEGISMDDIARGKSILRIFPKGQVTVLDGVSFIRRKPYITLFPRKAGHFDLIFVLQTKDSFFFIETEFNVEPAEKDSGPAASP